MILFESISKKLTITRVLSRMLQATISTKKVELSQLEEQYKALQTPTPQLDCNDFDNAIELMEARRDWQSSERDRLDKLDAISAILPKLRSGLKAQEQEFLKLKVLLEESFRELAGAALEANKLLNSAEEAIAKFQELSRKQAELGHQTVFNTQPYELYVSHELPIFVVNTAKVSLWGREQFFACQRSGNIGEGTRV